MYITLGHKDIKRSNRTFMELKLAKAMEDIKKQRGSNRTFMELKQKRVRQIKLV